MQNILQPPLLRIITPAVFFILILSNLVVAAQGDSGSPIHRHQPETHLILVQILESAVPISQTILTIIPDAGWGSGSALGLETTGADAIKSGSDIRAIGGAVLLDGTTRMITRGLSAGNMGDDAVNRWIKQIAMADHTISPAVQRHLDRYIRQITHDLSIETLDLDETDHHHQTLNIVQWTAEQAEAVFQMAFEQKDQKQAANLVPPADFYDQVFSVPAGGIIGKRILFP